MEQRLSFITLGVRDLARSKAFYERLGFVAVPSGGEGIVFFEMPGLVFALYPRHELAQDANQPEHNHPEGAFQGMALAHNARTRGDVDRLLAEAKAAGAHILKPAHDTFWGGYGGYFADPDGFAWEVAFNPHWPLTAEGAMTPRAAKSK